METEQDHERGKNLVAVKIFFGNEKLGRPAHQHQNSGSGTEGGQEMPAAVQRDQNQSCIKNGDVAEQAEGIVLSGGKHDRREEAAQHPEHCDDEGVQACGQKKRHRGDKRHQQKGQDRPEKLEVIKPPARKSDCVEHDNASGAKGLGQGRIIFARHQDASHQESQPGEEPQGGAQRGRDKVVVE